MTGGTGGASDIVTAESSGEERGLVSNLPYPRVNKTMHHTLGSITRVTGGTGGASDLVRVLEKNPGQLEASEDLPHPWVNKTKHHTLGSITRSCPILKKMFFSFFLQKTGQVGCTDPGNATVHLVRYQEKKLKSCPIWGKSSPNVQKKIWKLLVEWTRGGKPEFHKRCVWDTLK